LVSNLTTTPNAVVTFFAVWQANQYTIRFLANGGTGGTSGQMTYGTPLTPPAVTRTGYTLAGWSPTVPATVPAADTDYTAQWTAITYTINYNANGGAGSTTGSTHTYDVPKALTANGFSRTGYTFTGWALTSGGAKVYDDQEEVSNLSTTNGSSITLYAVWTINQYTISFDLNGGTGTTPSPITQNYNTSVTLPAYGSFIKAGYYCIGWNTTPGATTALSAYTVPANYATLYAVWVLSAADYSAVNAAAALANASTLPANTTNDPMYVFGGLLHNAAGGVNGFYARSMFSTTTINAMNAAIEAVVPGLLSAQQLVVDGYGAAITAAYNNLALAPADTTALGQLIAYTEGLDPDDYEYFGDVEYYLSEANDIYSTGYKKPLQSWVDAAMNDLQGAIDGLVWKPADYTAVNAVWNSIDHLNLASNYTAASIAALYDYYNTQIIWDLTRQEQSTVDGYATQLQNLKNALVWLPADYTAVDNALKAIPDGDGGLIAVDVNYLNDRYTSSSVTNLMNAVNTANNNRNKDKSEQAVVDSYATAITNARNALVPKTADYSYLGEALNTEPTYPQSYYTSASWADYADAVSAGWVLYNNQTLTIFQQQIINDATALINSTRNALELKAVTYTVKYRTTGGTPLASDKVENATAADWITEYAIAITGYTQVQASQQKQMTGTNEDNVFIFQYTINSYTVSFNANGGSAVSPITQNYKHQVAAPTAPTRTAYHFAGWYKDIGVDRRGLLAVHTGRAECNFLCKVDTVHLHDALQRDRKHGREYGGFNAHLRCGIDADAERVYEDRVQFCGLDQGHAGHFGTIHKRPEYPEPDPNG
jgi:uncharacterized repeat protein (TIGR02543 family)